MKLQTMLLPTGEFIFVAGGVTQATGESLPSVQSGIERAGATMMLAFTEDVEVVDALYDKNARRHEVRHLQGDTEYIPVSRDEELDDQEIGQLRDRVTEQLAGGREFSPAGLVKGRPGDPDFLSDPKFTTGGEPGVDPEPAGVVSDPIEVESSGVKRGDYVRIESVYFHDRTPFIGRTGRVVDVETCKQLVELENRGEGEPHRVWATSVHLVDAPEPELIAQAPVEEPQQPGLTVGDLVRIEAVFFPDRARHIGRIGEYQGSAGHGGAVRVRLARGEVIHATSVHLVDAPEPELIAQAPAAPEPQRPETD